MTHKNHHHRKSTSEDHDEMPNKPKREKRFSENPMGTFSGKKQHRDDHNQDITVNVTVNEKQEDCLTGCFKACFGIGKAAAK